MAVTDTNVLQMTSTASRRQRIKEARLPWVPLAIIILVLILGIFSELIGCELHIIYLLCSDENNIIGQDVIVVVFVVTSVLCTHPKRKKKIRIKRLFFTI